MACISAPRLKSTLLQYLFLREEDLGNVPAMLRYDWVLWALFCMPRTLGSRQLMHITQYLGLPR